MKPSKPPGNVGFLTGKEPSQGLFSCWPKHKSQGLWRSGRSAWRGLGKQKKVLKARKDSPPSDPSAHIQPVWGKGHLVSQTFKATSWWRLQRQAPWQCGPVMIFPLMLSSKEGHLDFPSEAVAPQRSPAVPVIHGTASMRPCETQPETVPSSLA